MGTNFFWRTELLLPIEPGLSMYDPRVHIGKRSAAGPYCWDCSLTLCQGGESAIHYGRSGWFDNCPKCGGVRVTTNSLSEGAAAIELGFAAPNVERPTGVRSTSSFSWAQDPERVGAICDQRANEQIVQDEYGRLLTGREFIDMLRANCPIQDLSMIGIDFS